MLATSPSLRGFTCAIGDDEIIAEGGHDAYPSPTTKATRNRICCQFRLRRQYIPTQYLKYFRDEPDEIRYSATFKSYQAQQNKRKLDEINRTPTAAESRALAGDASRVPNINHTKHGITG